MAETPRLFKLERDVDVSGVSGTGVVAWGAEWPDGSAVVRWATDRASTVVWASINDALAIHGHGGATRLIWLDQQVNREHADLRDEIAHLNGLLAEARGEASGQSMRVAQLELALEDAGVEIPADHPVGGDRRG